MAEPTAWVDLALLHAMVDSARTAAPLETGGMLIGYRSSPDSVVVTALIGAGPQASATATSFRPDSDWQQQRLEEIYVASGRTRTYLGDWHSHPGGDHRLSPRDRRTLRRIAETAEAHLDRPLMAIVVPDPSARIAVHERGPRHRGRHRRRLLRVRAF